MDIELARTFLEISRTGSFIAAAERLHVTQTTVTARVQNLEAQLGCRLFVRNRSGATLTDNGQRFMTHASQLVQTWDAARQELPLPEGSSQVLRLGAETSLWNPFLLNWVLALRREQPALVLHVEVGEASALHSQLEQGVLDTALVHQPDYWPGMQVEQLQEEKLILVRTPETDQPYVYVDWGPAFRKQHDAAHPEHSRAGLLMNLGPLALRLLLAGGGSGYFRTRVVQPYLDSGRLLRVSAAPEFSYPVYLVHARAGLTETGEQAIAVLREMLLTGESLGNMPVASPTG